MAILTAIMAFLSQSWIGQLVNIGINWWNARKAAQDGADSAQQTAETQHQADGAQSVADKTSADAQNEALDKLEQQIDNPTPVVVTPPTQEKKS